MFLFNTQNECNQMRNAVIRYKKENKVEHIYNEELQNLYDIIVLYWFIIYLFLVFVDIKTFLQLFNILVIG